MGSLIESWMSALDCLFDHRSPDSFTAPLFGDRLQGLDHQIKRLGRFRAFAVTVGPGRGSTARRHGGAAVRSAAFLAHQVVVINEFVAVADKKIRGRVLHSDSDHGLVVLPQLAYQW